MKNRLLHIYATIFFSFFQVGINYYDKRMAILDVWVQNGKPIMIKNLVTLSHHISSHHLINSHTMHKNFTRYDSIEYTQKHTFALDANQETEKPNSIPALPGLLKTRAMNPRQLHASYQTISNQINFNYHVADHAFFSHLGFFSM